MYTLPLNILDIILATYLCWDLQKKKAFSDYELWHLNNGPGILDDFLY